MNNHDFSEIYVGSTNPFIVVDHSRSESVKGFRFKDLAENWINSPAGALAEGFNPRSLTTFIVLEETHPLDLAQKVRRIAYKLPSRHDN